MRKAAQRIVEKLRLHGHEAFFAGGWVRDLLLRRKPQDIDIVTDARPDEVQRLFPHSRSIGAQFGVVQVHLYGHIYEVATFRQDSAYIDGRHPSSVTFSGPEQDALRRDFTINGLFYDPIADRLIDYVRGKRDIKNKLIRTIGVPAERFGEDKLRMLRALRFACNLGFKIAPETWEAIRNHAPDILQVSWERIRDELTKLFAGANPGDGLELLRASGLLAHILPEVDATAGVPAVPNDLGGDVFEHTRTTLALLRKPSLTLLIGTLLHDVGKPAAYRENRTDPFQDHAGMGAEIARNVCRRLRMSNEDTDRIADLVAAHEEFKQAGAMRENALRRLCRKPDLMDHLELLRANCLSNRAKPDSYSYCLKKFRQYEQEPAQMPLVNGDDLIGLGIAQGPLFRTILQAVEDLQMEGILRTREEAIRHIETTYQTSRKLKP